VPRVRSGPRSGGAAGPRPDDYWRDFGFNDGPFNAGRHQHQQRRRRPNRNRRGGGGRGPNWFDDFPDFEFGQRAPPPHDARAWSEQAQHCRCAMEREAAADSFGFAAFFAQQAAELMFKARLPRSTHQGNDITQLLPQDATEEERAAARRLSAHFIGGRYPQGAGPAPAAAMGREAFEQAQRDLELLTALHARTAPR
jgi:HEPN domain-containing protein